MEDHDNHSMDEENNFEGSTTNTGPKGVINDWRKFKLESEDQEAISPNKKEILRQMSSPYKAPGKEHTNTRENFNRKMSTQEYGLIHDKEDENCLQKYRKQCMQDMHQRLSFGPRYGYLCELKSGEEVLEVIAKEQKSTSIIVHIYEDGLKGCDTLNNCLAYLALDYPSVKFCKIKASETGANDRFSKNVLPTVLAYKNGELISNFISVTEKFNEEFFAVDVESHLNAYGLLPEKERLIFRRDNARMGDTE
ncbi:phosducin [Microcaecilia unicolor]|uniref:Phosducin n=1 Tax=Microcaecilia unicolor TaxID=1415580 RepID=A0A6P7YCF8_9AMPH|nr:phosducin [Microcaecilia unicolor]